MYDHIRFDFRSSKRDFQNTASARQTQFSNCSTRIVFYTRKAQPQSIELIFLGSSFFLSVKCLYFFKYRRKTITMPKCDVRNESIAARPSQTNFSGGNN